MGPSTPRGVAAARLVLVADDDPAIRTLVKMCLSDEGFLCAAYGDGLELLQALGRLRPAAILLDIRMPRLDGFGVLERLRADALLRAIPVVAISAEAEPALTLAAGCRAFLAKPFDLTDLLRAVRVAIE